MTRRKDPAETRIPVAAEDLPTFDSVPVKYRHDGWTPARQKAFFDTCGFLWIPNAIPAAAIEQVLTDLDAHAPRHSIEYAVEWPVPAAVARALRRRRRRRRRIRLKSSVGGGGGGGSVRFGSVRAGLHRRRCALLQGGLRPVAQPRRGDHEARPAGVASRFQ